MALNIEIREGHGGSSFFWFIPVTATYTSRAYYDEVTEYTEEFAIVDDDVLDFLLHFLLKYFDNDLPCNRERCCICAGVTSGFDGNLEHNLYTYETLYRMLQDIRDTASMMNSDYNNPILDDVKDYFCTEYYYLDCVKSDGLEQTTAEIIDFYNRFSDRLEQMMQNNPQTNLISIMGP